MDDLRHPAPGANINEIFSKIVEEIQTNHDDGHMLLGLSTGIAGLDERLKGFRAGALTVLAGRPGMGHTTLAQHIAMHVASIENRPVIYFTASRNSKVIGLEMLAVAADLEPNRLHLGKLDDAGWDKLSSALGKLFQLPIKIEPIITLDAKSLIERTNSLIGEFKRPVGLIIIEGLEALDFASLDNHDHHEFFRSLLENSQQHGCPILILSPLNRSLEQRGDLRPRLGDLPYHGQLEVLAENVLLVYREGYYDPCGSSNSELHIAKSAHGPLGRVILSPELTSFSTPFTVS
jgi:replicative DNA helicase